MNAKQVSVLFATALVLAAAYYSVEPWAVTFVDDGPYYSTEYSGPVEDLVLHSAVQLRRLGTLVYTMESRSLADRDSSVLVLRSPNGTVHWARKPVKPNGELGRVEVRKASPTWYGGWRVSIKPSNQESGSLYLSVFGDFRFFNRSW